MTTERRSSDDDGDGLQLLMNSAALNIDFICLSHHQLCYVPSFPDVSFSPVYANYLCVCVWVILFQLEARHTLHTHT